MALPFATGAPQKRVMVPFIKVAIRAWHFWGCSSWITHPLTSDNRKWGFSVVFQIGCIRWLQRIWSCHKVAMKGVLLTCVRTQQFDLSQKWAVFWGKGGWKCCGLSKMGLSLRGEEDRNDTWVPREVIREFERERMRGESHTVGLVTLR